MTIPYINSFIGRLRRHPLAIGVGVVVVLFLWVGWLAYAHVLSPAPTEADIAQQTVRFNKAGFTAITAASAQYHQPLELPTFPRNPFSLKLAP